MTERDGIDETMAAKRFASQHSEDFFEKNSDFVIANNGSLENTVKMTEIVIKKIKDGKIGSKNKIKKEEGQFGE